MNLEQSRAEIDSIDRQLAELINRRMDVTKEVAAYKLANNLPIFHPQREAAVLEKVTALSPKEYSEGVRAVFQCIMDESKKLQLLSFCGKRK